MFFLIAFSVIAQNTYEYIDHDFRDHQAIDIFPTDSDFTMGKMHLPGVAC